MKIDSTKISAGWINIDISTNRQLSRGLRFKLTVNSYLKLKRQQSIDGAMSTSILCCYFNWWSLFMP